MTTLEMWEAFSSGVAWKPEQWGRAAALYDDFKIADNEFGSLQRAACGRSFIWLLLTRNDGDASPRHDDWPTWAVNEETRSWLRRSAEALDVPILMVFVSKMVTVKTDEPNEESFRPAYVASYDDVASRLGELQRSGRRAFRLVDLRLASESDPNVIDLSRGVLR